MEKKFRSDALTSSRSSERAFTLSLYARDEKLSLFWLQSCFWPLSRGDRSKITCHFRWEIISAFRIRWKNSKIPTRTGARGENVTTRPCVFVTCGHVFTSSSGSGWNFWIFPTDSESWDDFPSKMTCYFWPISTGKGSKTRLKSKIPIFHENRWFSRQNGHARSGRTGNDRKLKLCVKSDISRPP